MTAHYDMLKKSSQDRSTMMTTKYLTASQNESVNCIQSVLGAVDRFMWHSVATPHLQKIASLSVDLKYFLIEFVSHVYCTAPLRWYSLLTDLSFKSH